MAGNLKFRDSIADSLVTKLIIPFSIPETIKEENKIFFITQLSVGGEGLYMVDTTNMEMKDSEVYDREGVAPPLFFEWDGDTLKKIRQLGG